MKISTALQLKEKMKEKAVIALVGAGGKTSTMFRLGQELSALGKRVLLTTTTRIAAEQTTLGPTLVTFDPKQQSLADLLAALGQATTQANPILLIEALEPDTGKARGVAPAVIDKIAESNLFEVIINEADGAKKRPFKAPAAHEPVIPASTTLVIPTVGLSILGQPLTTNTVFRPELVETLGQTGLNQPITPAVIAKVLTHPAGGLKHIPDTAQVVPLLNQVSPTHRAQAKQVAAQILQHPRITAVMVGAVQEAEPIHWVQNRVAAVILAAGQASRFGSPKQLALWQGQPLLARAIDTALASQVDSVIVVLGAHADQCRAVIGDRPVQTIFNPDWQAGQSTSLKAGLAALPETISAAAFLLADQPQVTAAVIDQLITAYQQTLAPLVWPEYQGKRGNPILFDNALFADMQTITGDTGARPILKAYQAQAQRINTDEPGILFDVDTPDAIPK